MTAYGAHGVVEIDRVIYAFGGTGWSGWLSSGEAYDSKSSYQ